LADSEGERVSEKTSPKREQRKKLSAKNLIERVLGVWNRTGRRG
jgi:hypothetical protein